MDKVKLKKDIIKIVNNESLLILLVNLKIRWDVFQGINFKIYIKWNNKYEWLVA